MRGALRDKAFGIVAEKWLKVVYAIMRDVAKTGARICGLFGPVGLALACFNPLV